MCGIGFVYKWTNTLNGRWYVGSHKGLPNDGYTGSGKVFQLAYKKYKSHFKREILFFGHNYRDVETSILLQTNAKEDKLSYNLTNQGSGFLKGSENPNYGDSKKNPMYGKKSWNNGRPMTEEEKINLARSRTRGKIYCEYLDVTFESALEAAKALGVSKSSFNYYLSGRMTNKYGLKRLL